MSRTVSGDTCTVCGAVLGEQTLLQHRLSCAKDLALLSKKSSDPFQLWKSAVSSDHLGNFEESEREFKNAAQFFFDSASTYPGVSKAMFEFSTLMEAFAEISRGRRFLTENNFDAASEVVPHANEVLRSTLHFAFLAPYVSACMTLETIAGMGGLSDDQFQSYRTANYLLEQSKFALSLRDDSDPLLISIDALLMFSIAGTLHFEARQLSTTGKNDLAQDKESRSKDVRREYVNLAGRAGLVLDELEYFPQREFIRREREPLLLGYPDTKKLLLVNLGKHTAIVQKLGKMILSQEIQSMASHAFELSGISKGKVRVEYVDQLRGEKYDVGCMTLV